MNIQKLYLTKDHLSLFPEKERVFFILLGHLANEISVLTKLMILSENRSETEVVRKAYSMQASIIARIIIGKLYESWVLLEMNFFKSKLSKQYESKLTNDGQQALRNLKKYFGKKNLIKSIRNNFSFHYPSFDEINKQLKAIPNDTNFQFFLGECNANTNYYMSEEVISNLMLNQVKSKDTTLQDAMFDVFQDLTQVSEWFVTFSGDCMITLSEEFLGKVKDKLKLQTIEVESQGNIWETKIPFFLDWQKKLNFSD